MLNRKENSIYLGFLTSNHSTKLFYNQNTKKLFVKKTGDYIYNNDDSNRDQEQHFSARIHEREQTLILDSTSPFNKFRT